MKVLNKISLAITVSFLSALPCWAEENNPLAKYLAAPGATVTKEVAAAKKPFEKDFVQSAYDSFNSFHAQMGGDHTLYYLTHFNSVMRTDLIKPHAEQKVLKRNLNKDILKLSIQTNSAGELTFEEYINHPLFRHQGVMIIHKGEVVFEAYPGMQPTDVHLWASASKTLSGLIVAQMVEEGKLDLNKPATYYAPEFKGSAWDIVTVRDLVNHTAGLDHEETNQSILDPEGVFVRFVMASIGSTQQGAKIENWRDVLKEVQPLKGEKPGERFRYSSLNTQVLGQVIENIAGLRWSDVAEKRIWGKLGARMPLLIHLAPDGTGLNMAFMSSTLEDFAKYATLYTPSWAKVGHEQVVTPSLLEQIRSAGSPEAFVGGAKHTQALGLFAEDPVKGAYQFDFFFKDGAMYKHGNTGQGIFIDPARDVAAVYFSATPYVEPYGEIKKPAYFRKIAHHLAGN